MSEEELAVFDLLTKPEPVLDAADRETVKGKHQTAAGASA